MDPRPLQQRRRKKVEANLNAFLVGSSRSSGKPHASQPEATRASISPASGAHDTGPVNDEGLRKLIALGKYVRCQLSTIHDNSTSLQAAMVPRIRVDTLL